MFYEVYSPGAYYCLDKIRWKQGCYKISQMSERKQPFSSICTQFCGLIGREEALILNHEWASMLSQKPTPRLLKWQGSRSMYDDISGTVTCNFELLKLQ